MASSGSHGKGAPFEIEKQLLPRLRALTHAVDQAGELLLVLGRRPNDNQKALCRVLQPGPHVDAVDPEVRNASPRDRTGVTRHQLSSIGAPCGRYACRSGEIYAPRQGNEGLLLGLKGSLNEYELDLLRQRSIAARHEKARRGELIVMAKPRDEWLFLRPGSQEG